MNQPIYIQSSRIYCQNASVYNSTSNLVGDYVTLVGDYMINNQQELLVVNLALSLTISELKG